MKKYKCENDARDSETAGISPVVPKSAHICHIYEITDAGEAGKDLDTEPVKVYGALTTYRGVKLHSNHESEGGGRTLVR